MTRTLSFVAIVALSLLSAACTTLSPEQMAAYQARQARAEARATEQGIFTNNPALLASQSSTQAPAMIANRSH